MGRVFECFDEGYTRGRGRVFFRGRGKTDGAPCGAGHQMSFFFCKTEISKELHDGIESIYQSKIDSSLNSDSKIVRRASVTF